MTNTKFDYALLIPCGIYIYFGNICYKYLQEASPKFFPSPKRRKSPPPPTFVDSPALWVVYGDKG